MFSRPLISLGVLIGMAFLELPVRAASLGEVHFPTSCKPDVQSTFDSGVALLHSFEFREAEGAFRKVEQGDPKCVIAAWGVALSTTERAGAIAPQKDLLRAGRSFSPGSP